MERLLFHRFASRLDVFRYLAQRLGEAILQARGEESIVVLSLSLFLDVRSLSGWTGAQQL